MSTNDTNQGVGISDGLDKELLKVYLAEYDSLRSEQLARISNQQQAFQFLVAVLAAGVTTVVSLLNAAILNSEMLPQYALLLPMVATPLAFIFVDNEIMIFGIGGFISGHLKMCIQGLVNSKTILLSDGRRFTYTKAIARSVHPLISAGRWTLFLLPVAGPILAVVADWEKWGSYEPWAWFFLIVDLILVALTIYGLVAVINARQNWINSEKDNFENFQKDNQACCRSED